MARLAPDACRAKRSLADLLDDAERLHTAAELNHYVSRLPTGSMCWLPPADVELAASPDRQRYGELVAFRVMRWCRWIWGLGVAGPLVRLFIDRADQLVLVTTPEWVTATVVLEALSCLRDERTTVGAEQVAVARADLPVLEERFRARHLNRCVTIPYDEPLTMMRDTGSYCLDARRRETRVAVKQLGVAVAEQLV